MAGEKNEREVVRVENAQYTDGAGGPHTGCWGGARNAQYTDRPGGDTHGSGGHTAGAVRVDNAQYNDRAGATHWGHGWGGG